HPAGTKQFSSLAKTATFEFDYQSTRSISIDTLYLRSSFTPADLFNTKSLTTIKSNTTDVLDSISLSGNKYIIGDSVVSGHG
ncbi:hypothetical protein ABK046_50680, partial [Streptomyces caeruleatus]